MLSIKNKISYSLGYNYKLNKKSLSIKKSFDEVIAILNDIGKKMNSV